MEVLNGGQGLRAFYARFPSNRETQGTSDRMVAFVWRG